MRPTLLVPALCLSSLFFVACGREAVSLDQTESALESPAAGQVYQLRNACSGRSLDVVNASAANGARLDVWTYWSGTNQQFLLETTSLGGFTLRAQNSGKVLDVDQSSSAAHAPVIQYATTGGKNQSWSFVADSSGGYLLVPAHAPSMALTLASGDANGSLLEIDPVNHACAQRWTLTKVSLAVMPHGNLAGWTQEIAEDFNTPVPLGQFPGPHYPELKVYPDGTLDNSKHAVYMPSRTLSVVDGMLDVWAHTENGKHLCMALMPVGMDQIYGRYSLRFRADPMPFYGSVFMFWPQGDLAPQHGELDWPEGHTDGFIKGFFHYASVDGGQLPLATTTTYQDWHVATLEWTPGKAAAYLDGVLVKSFVQGPGQNLPQDLMHLVFQCGASGGIPADATQGHIQVDWLTLYSRAS